MKNDKEGTPDGRTFIRNAMEGFRKPMERIRGGQGKPGKGIFRGSDGKFGGVRTCRAGIRFGSGNRVEVENVSIVESPVRPLRPIRNIMFRDSPFGGRLGIGEREQGATKKKPDLSYLFRVLSNPRLSLHSFYGCLPICFIISCIIFSISSCEGIASCSPPPNDGIAPIPMASW